MIVLLILSFIYFLIAFGIAFSLFFAFRSLEESWREFFHDAVLALALGVFWLPLLVLLGLNNFLRGWK